MALSFRHDPPPFGLTPEYHELLRTSPKGSIPWVFFSFAFEVTADKRKKLLALSDFRPVAFTDMCKQIKSYITSLNEMDKERSLRLAVDSQAKNNHKTKGFYSFDGVFVGEFGFKTGEFIITVQSMRAADDYRRKQQQREQDEAFATAEAESSAAAMAKGMAAAERGRESYAKHKAEEAKREADQASERRKQAEEKAGTSEDHARTDENSAAKVTSEQAEKIAKEGLVLDQNLPSKYKIGSFNLGSRQRQRGFSEVHVPVQRGGYGGITTNIVEGKKGGYVVTGPTGCGKSTVALLPLFDDENSTVLIVEPTQANAANIYHEFTNILPNMVASGVISGVVPEAKFIAPTVARPPFPRLMITTTEKLLEYFYYSGKLPESTYLVLDEFHLPVPTMVETVELLRTFDVVPKYVLVSATAVGFDVIAQYPQGLTHTYCNLKTGVIPGKLERSDLDPRRWFNVGDGTVAVFAPSVSVARLLHGVYLSWGLRSFLITRRTTVTQYMKAATDYRPRTVFVCEPAVEAGITLSISVLISMGATTAIRYDGKVVVEDTQPLDANAEIQRGSRGARVKPTLYLTTRNAASSVVSSTADYFRAQSVIKMAALGASVRQMTMGGLLESFPKLATLTKDSAAQAVAQAGDPFLAVYKTAPSGGVYRECGGKAEGFMELARKELFLYHYSKGFFVSPIADFSDVKSKPHTFVVRGHQFDAATAVVDSVPGLATKYKLEDLVAMVIEKFDVYVEDLFVRLRGVFSESKPTAFTLSGSTRAPEVKDFLREAPAIVKLFDYLQTQPLGVVYERKVSGGGDNVFSEIRFVYGKHVLNFAFPTEYMSGKGVNVTKLSESVDKLLRGLLCIEILLNGAPEKCVNLEYYKGRVSTDHVWFAENVV